MLVTMKEMLADARKNHYAIPAFDISNYEMMRAVLEACEEERSPALLMGLGVDLKGRGMPLIASMVKEASNHFNIPVCFHLDHATEFQLIKDAIDAGFSSVMYDGSVLDFENNAIAYDCFAIFPVLAHILPTMEELRARGIPDDILFDSLNWVDRIFTEASSCEGKPIFHTEQFKLYSVCIYVNHLCIGSLRFEIYENSLQSVICKKFSILKK